MNPKRIYDEVKALSFSEGYFLCYPIKLDGDLVTYTAVVVPRSGEDPEFNIKFSGQNIKYEIDKSDNGYRFMIDRLDMPAGNVKLLKFTLRLSDSTKEIVCQHRITSKQIGCSYYVPSSLLRHSDGIKSKHMLRVIQNDDELYYLLSGFDDYMKLKTIIKSSVTTVFPNKNVDNRQIHTKTSTNRSFQVEQKQDKLKVLDWGVGAGRVADHMRRDNEIEMYGVDIDPVNMSVLHNAGFSRDNYKLMEPGGEIPFQDEMFDAVYGISVFTHLTEDLQFKYLNELKRVIKPGGVGIFSVHGFIHFFSRINDGNMFYNWMNTGFLVVSDNYDLTENFAESNTNKLYVNTLHTPNYIFEQWLTFFPKIHIVKAPNPYGHDLLVCQK